MREELSEGGRGDGRTEGGKGWGWRRRKNVKRGCERMKEGGLKEEGERMLSK